MSAGLLAISVLFGAPAQADVPKGEAKECLKGSFCIWKGINYTGAWLRGTHTSLDVGGKRFNDTASSLWNRTPVPVCVYADTIGLGPRLTIRPGGSLSNLTNSYFNPRAEGASMNDRISSWVRC